MHWTLADRIGELASENETSWNQMAVSLIELGIPLFSRIKQRAPKVAKSLTRKRYTFQLRPRAQERVERYAEVEAGKIRLDDRISAALPGYAKQMIRREASRTNRKMSQILRDRLGVKF